MPKIVDHDERRRDIVAATMRVIARSGVASATMREIAKESGYTTGMVSHYFPTKQALMSQVHRSAFLTVNERIRGQQSRFDTLDALRDAVFEALPLDEEKLLEAQVDVAFWDEALREESFREERWRNHAEAQAGWTELFATLRRAGVIDAPESDVDLAIELVALIDGLVVQRLLYPKQMSPTVLRAVVERHIARLRPIR